MPLWRLIFGIRSRNGQLSLGERNDRVWRPQCCALAVVRGKEVGKPRASAPSGSAVASERLAVTSLQVGGEESKGHSFDVLPARERRRLWPVRLMRWALWTMRIEDGVPQGFGW